MSGPKRNPDRLNTIGIVVVGICSAVLVYVSIVALQAFYMNDSSEIQTMADYGGNDLSARTIRTSQIQNITEFGANAAAPGKTTTYRTSIDVAMKQVIDAAKVDPAALVPAAGRADKPTVQPVFGRPTPAAATTAPDGGGPAAGAGTGSAAGTGTGSATGAGTGSATGAGAGSATGAGTGSAAGAGSAAPAGGLVVPMSPTGGTGQGGGTRNPATGGAPAPAGATGAPAKGNVP